ncbi:hypothetical protein ACFTWF_37040 [Rhodococcus sp. NPDC056960]|uniref:hypothetical protein n=1 Tax=Rhodococcus sp. NPDC056960 TaxID=3345982 RepID=UPI00362A4328
MRTNARDRVALFIALSATAVAVTGFAIGAAGVATAGPHENPSQLQSDLLYGK